MVTPSEHRYDIMQYRYCGKSGLKLPMISLGLWHNFGGVDSFEKGRRILHRAFDLGITHFDLANNYGPPPGSAEEVFGRILAGDFSGFRDEMVISTKAGYWMWSGPYGDGGSKKYLKASLDQSLKRLGLDYVDIFYSHRPDPETPMDETMEALAQAVQSGKALYAGISNYSPAQTQSAVKILDAMGIHCLVHQVKYNIFDREPEKELFDTLAQLGMGCTVFSPLAQGLLTSKYIRGIPPDSRASSPHGFLKTEDITLERVETAAKLNRIAQSRGQSLAQMALSWILRDQRVTSVITGVSRIEQLDDSIGALDSPDWTADELAEIEVLTNSGKNGQTELSVSF